MEQKHNIFEQFKVAAQEAETKPFPNMDKIWTRVDEKLDKKRMAKKSNFWKKIAIAASIVAILSITYQFFKPTQIINNVNNTTVSVDTTNTIITTPNQKGLVYDNLPNIKNNSRPKVTEQINISPYSNTNKSYTITTDSIMINSSANAIVMSDELPHSEQPKQESNEWDNSKEKGYFYRDDLHKSKGVYHEKNEADKKEMIQEKLAPLVLVNGKPILENQVKNAKNITELLSQFPESELENVAYLAEPLYIINGVEYSEESLFGKNPTSPYAPLNKQEIEKIEIFESKEAIEKFGKKGEKGIVIIATKGGKPIIINPKR